MKNDKALVVINKNEILEILKFYKFTYDENQVNKTVRESGPHEGYAEYIFYKN